MSRRLHVVGRVVASAAIAVGLGVLVATPAVAAGMTRYVATTGNDSGACAVAATPCRTLAYALGQAANVGDTIQLAAGTYVNTNVTIDKTVVVKGTAGSAGATVLQSAPVNPNFGSPILPGSVLTISDGTVTAPFVTVADLTVTGGQTVGSGGGIDQTSTGTVTVSDSVVSGNSSNAGGGGIAVAAGNVTVQGSTITANTANTGSDGGGMFLGNTLGTTGVAAVAVRDSTITDNTAGDPGGGIADLGQSLRVTDSTVTSNSAFNAGGGIFSAVVAPLVTSTIVSANTSTKPFFGTTTDNCSGLPGTGFPAVLDGGHDLEAGTTCGFTAATDLHGDPRLGALGDNGGPTPTLLPGAGSAAVDAGGPGPCPDPIDQRGLARPAGPACDIGAVEVGPTRYVATTGTDTGACTDPAAPCATVAYALAQSDPFGDTIDVAPGYYTTVHGVLAVDRSITIAGTSPRAADTVLAFELTTSGAPLTLQDLELTQSESGAIVATNAPVVLHSVDVSGESALITGAGVDIRGGSLLVADSTFSNDTVSFASAGAAIDASGTAVTILDSTFTGDQTSGSGGAVASAGGGTVSVTDSTIDANSAAVSGGGFSVSPASALSITRSIVAANTASSGANCAGAATDGAHDLTDDASCGLASPTDVTASPGLGALGDNGGPTPTQLPDPSSLALDAAGQGCAGTLDQRGVARPQGPACDIGAVEVAVAPPSSVPEVAWPATLPAIAAASAATLVLRRRRRRRRSG